MEDKLPHNATIHYPATQDDLNFTEAITFGLELEDVGPDRIVGIARHEPRTAVRKVVAGVVEPIEPVISTTRSSEDVVAEGMVGLTTDEQWMKFAPHQIPSSQWPSTFRGKFSRRKA